MQKKNEKKKEKKKKTMMSCCGLACGLAMVRIQGCCTWRATQHSMQAKARTHLALPKSFTLKQNLNVQMVEGQEDQRGKGLQNKENGMS